MINLTGTYVLGHDPLDAVTCYFFHEPPPKESRLYFAEKQLIGMVLFRPGQYTLPGATGRWTLHRDPPPHPFSEEAAKQPWKFLKDELPGMRLKYTDWETDKTWIWVLTDQVIPGHLDRPRRDLRLGRWPD
jgi:hypothetical protein